MIVDAGYMALVIALIVAVYVIVASFLGVWQRVPELVISGRNALYTIPLLALISTLALVYAFVNNDFSVRYVSENSSLSMPHAYTWVALYAGNAGSLLFLALVFSALAVFAILSMHRKLPQSVPYITMIMAVFIVFLLGITVFLANPLERLEVVPMDGQGINPLLVHFGMFIHPPVQMAGLVSVAVPFSIAMGMLLTRRVAKDEWVDIGRTWSMISWLILTMGLLLGSWWAYTILGWGGYWAWDPVENAALMPWLAMTALVHSIMVQKRRGMFRMWNMVLVIVGFTLAQLGMFINRGGPVPSVHSFAESTMGWLFLAFMAFTMLASIVVFLWRMDTLKSRASLDSMLSRESVFLIQNVLFLVVAFVTLWGTVFPVFSDVAQGTTVTVGQPFFNQVNGPLLLALIFLMGIGPLVPWRKARGKNLVNALKYPIMVTVTTMVILGVIGIHQPFALAAFGACSLTVTGIVREWVRGTMARHRRGETYPAAFGRLLVSNRPRYGGYIVHLAIVMLAVGVVGSSFYSVQRDIVMKPGDTGLVGDYTFQYLAVSRTIFPDREEQVAEIAVYDGEEYLGIMKPFRSVYPDFRIAATRGAIRSTLLEDFYIVASEFSADGQAVFRVLINPLVWWMWASGPVLLFGAILALSPQRHRASASLRPSVHPQITKA